MAEAPDRSWFTEPIRTAFETSAALWEEVAPPESPQVMSALFERYGVDAERSLLQRVSPRLRARMESYATELAMDRGSLERLRPWAAYHAFALTFRPKNPTPQPESPDNVLSMLALAAGKPRRYEYPTFEALVQWLAGLPYEAQTQYLEWLFDHFDAERKGVSAAQRYGWLHGKPGSSLDSLSRMRAKPELYRAMQLERNARWAERVRELLDAGETAFVSIGMLHVLGSDGIPRQLRRLGVTVRESAEFVA